MSNKMLKTEIRNLNNDTREMLSKMNNVAHDHYHQDFWYGMDEDMTVESFLDFILFCIENNEDTDAWDDSPKTTVFTKQSTF